MSTTKNNKNKFLSAVNLCLVLVVVLGGLYFLKSMDDVMVKNLELEQLKTDLNALQEEKQELDYRKNALGSYENVSARLDDLKMVKVTDIEYISVGDDSLAKK
ncbi:MAG TPA: hypothetical protein PK142_01135 [bacterium]|nr:hypothetical protein [bacterium]